MTPVLSLLAILVLVALAGCNPGNPVDDPRADPGNAARVAGGAAIYTRHCAACHGMKLEGQPEWRVRLPNGRLPAPPHDDSGHTWHHPDAILFGIIKSGMVPPYAPAAYQSDMPPFGGTLSDEEIWAVLAYIKSRWSGEVMRQRTKIGTSAPG